MAFELPPRKEVEALFNGERRMEFRDFYFVLVQKLKHSKEIKCAISKDVVRNAVFMAADYLEYQGSEERGRGRPAVIVLRDTE